MDKRSMLPREFLRILWAPATESLLEPLKPSDRSCKCIALTSICHLKILKMFKQLATKPFKNTNPVKESFQMARFSKLQCLRRLPSHFLILLQQSKVVRLDTNKLRKEDEISDISLKQLHQDEVKNPRCFSFCVIST
jgi:hypothetical protein